MTVLYHHELFKKMFSKEKQRYLHDVLLLCHDESLNLLQIIVENLKNINSGYNIAFKENNFRAGYSDLEELMNDRTDDQSLKIHKILKNVPSLRFNENPK